MATDDDVIAVVQEILEELPSENVNDQCWVAFTKMLENIPKLVISGIEMTKFHQYMNVTDSLIAQVTALSEKSDVYQETRFNPFYFLFRLFRKSSETITLNFTKLHELYETRNFDMIQDVKKEMLHNFVKIWRGESKKCELVKQLRKEYIEGIRNLERAMADKMLKSCTASAALMIISESYRIFVIWNHIKDAENCILENIDKEQVELNLANIESEIQKLVKLQVDFDNSTDRENLLDIIDETEGSLIKIRDLITATISLIDKVKADINGKKELLLADDLNLTVNISSNIGHIVVNGFQLVSAFDTGSSFWRYASGVAFSAMFVVVGANVVLKTLTKDTIEKCRATYQEMKQLGERVKHYQLQAEDIRRWLRRSERQLTNN